MAGPISNGAEKQVKLLYQGNTLGPTSAGEPGPMQDKECQASHCRELHLMKKSPIVYSHL